MHDDDPGDVVHDALAAALYGDHPLGRPVIGSVESIEALSRASIAGYYKRRYVPTNMVVAAAGGLDHDTVVALVEDAFGDLLSGDGEPAGLRPTSRRVPTTAGVVSEQRPTEQTNLVLGCEGLRRGDPRRFSLQVLNAALGGGMSSRLFQEVREQRGLAYSVYSYSSHLADTGLFGVYAGCAPGRTRDVLDLCREVLDEVADHGLTDEEVRRAQGQLKGSLVLGLEDTGSKMSRIGKSELVHGELLTVDEVLGRIDAVTPDDVRDVAYDVLRRPQALALIGPFDEQEFA